MFNARTGVTKQGWARSLKILKRGRLGGFRYAGATTYEWPRQVSLASQHKAGHVHSPLPWGETIDSPFRMLNFSKSCATVGREHVITKVSAQENGLIISWKDGHESTFHYIWLRDCCRCSKCFHPTSQERQLATADIPLDIRVKSVRLNKAEGILDITWDDAEGHVSRYSGEWLRAHCYSESPSGNALFQDSSAELSLWDASIIHARPQINYDAICAEGTHGGLERWLDLLHRYGFALIKNVPTEPGQCIQLARRIGFPRETFWGRSFDVKVEASPKNLSLTGMELKCHTDFSWAPQPPGLQFLHCLARDPNTEGGETILVDGFKIASIIKKLDMPSFRLLSRLRVPHRFMSDGHYYYHRAPIIELDDTSNVIGIRHNHANRAPLHVPAELMEDAYRALHVFSKLTEESTLRWKHMLTPGDMLVFDNRRVLHGRASFSRSTSRHLEGCYLDAEEFQSRRATLRFPSNPDLPPSYRAQFSSSSPSPLPPASPREMHRYAQLAPTSSPSPSLGAFCGPAVSLTNRLERLATSSSMSSFASSFLSRSPTPGTSGSNRPGAPLSKETTNSKNNGSIALHATDRKSLGTAKAPPPYGRPLLQRRMLHRQPSPPKATQEVSFVHMKDGTAEDYALMGDLYSKDMQDNMLQRVLDTLAPLKGVKNGGRIDLYDHSLQAATRAYRDGADDEVIVCALLHDIGELLSPQNHGEIAAALLRPFISPENYWVLANHEVYQGHYYFHHLGGNRHARDIYAAHPCHHKAIHFCEAYDQCSFDPSYDNLKLEDFTPHLSRILKRDGYWFDPANPKLGAVTGNRKAA